MFYSEYEPLFIAEMTTSKDIFKFYNEEMFSINVFRGGLAMASPFDFVF